VHNFFTNLKSYLHPADKNVGVSSYFKHYNLDMWPLQGNHNMLCDIHIFSATTTTAAEVLHFSIQELATVKCSGHVQVKFRVVFFVQRKLCVAFSAKIKFCVFICGTMCVIIFFSGVQLVQRKYLSRFYVMKRNSAVRFSQIKTKLSYLAISKAKQKCCLGPGDIKTVITFLLYNFLISNLAIATVSVIFTFFPLLE